MDWAQTQAKELEALLQRANEFVKAAPHKAGCSYGTFYQDSFRTVMRMDSRCSCGKDQILEEITKHQKKSK